MNHLEKEILGCFLKDNDLINETNISVNHFESESSKLLYQSMLVLSSQGKVIDQVTLLAENYEYIQRLGGVGFITELKATGNVDHFESYEKQFIEQFKKRESKNVVTNWLSKDEKIESLISMLQKIDEEGITDEVDIKELIMEIGESPFSERETKRGIPSGLSDLDKYLGGFNNQESYIIGARPSMGKTAFMLKLAKSAMDNDTVPLIFSLEMSKESLLKRYFSSIANVNSFLAQVPQSLTDGQKESWKQAGLKLAQMDFEIFDEPMQTIQSMRSRIRKAQRKYEGKQIIVFIDYLTLIQATGTYYSDHAKVTDISANLKAMAKDYDCPVITLAQLSRAVEQRQDKRPMLSDLRESGSIEQDADCVMFLYRESYYNEENKSNELEVNIAKHRNGPTGKATVYYNKATGKMGDLSVY